MQYASWVNVPKSSIEIHCWGGLGSQFYAWALMEDLRQNDPSRFIKLVLHSSGVTERKNELSFLADYFEIVEIHDFHEAASSLPERKIISAFSSFLTRFVKWVAVKSRFVLDANSNSAYRKIMPWTRQLRGHYSSREISDQTVARMMSRIGNLESQLANEQAGLGLPRIALHMRLGDLVSLDSKGPVSFDLVAKQIELALYDSQDISTLEVASDTLDLAVNEIQSRLSNLDVIGLTGSTLDVILRFQNSKVFIGTNSKVSVWVAIFSLQHPGERSIFLPIGIAHHLRANLPNSLKLRCVTFY